MTTEIPQKPEHYEIKRFVEVFDRLSKYEAQQRCLVRGYGAFSAEEVEKMPCPIVCKVYAWLESLSELPELPPS